MVERICAGADEGRESKRTKTAVLKFVDHFLSLIHQSSDLGLCKQIAYSEDCAEKIQQCGSPTGLED